MKLWSFTFGCKVNQYETELLRHRLIGKADHHVQDFKDADICLINSCSVTGFADKECRQLIRKVLRENEHARVIVTGCYATRAPEEVKKISDRLEVYTNQEKEELPSCVGFELNEKPLGIHHFAGRTRAFLKVQDGCQAPCNYCIIPTVRPQMWSKPLSLVLDEALTLIANGYQEIVLTGIRLGLYLGEDKKGTKTNLVGLLRQLIDLEGHFRVRLSSLEVTEVSEQLIKLVEDSPKICRHFHIPMQSGNSQVLKDMRRWYNTETYRSRIESIRLRLPDCGLTADVMVGYPTETDELFEKTGQFIEDLALSGLHVFRFSARKGTTAAKLKALDPRIVTQRAHILRELDKQLRHKFYQRFEGTVREVLPEPSGEGWSDNYIRVDVPLEQSLGLSHMRVWSRAYSGQPQKRKIFAAIAND